MRASVAVALLVLLAACGESGTATPTASASDPPRASPSGTPASAAASVPSTRTPSPPRSETARWARLDAAGPPAREDHTWTADATASTAYLFGGRGRQSEFGDLWAFDLATDTWSELEASGGPAARFGHEAVWVEGVGLVVFGGQSGTSFFNDLWAFDPATAAWQELPADGDVPAPRYGTCSGVGPDGRLWISHGFTSDGTRFADTVAYDFETATWTGETPSDPLPVKRCLHGCWWTDAGALTLYGGQTFGTTALGDLWLLADGVWTQANGDLPTARNLYARGRVDGATVVFGGQAADSTYLGDAWIFPDGEAGARPVSVQGAAPSPRAGAEMVADPTRGRLLLFGGRDADGAYADVWSLEGARAEG